MAFLPSFRRFSQFSRQSTLLPVVLLLCGAGSGILSGAEPAVVAAKPVSATSESLKGLSVKLAKNPKAQQQLTAILAEATRVRDLPLVQRAASLEELRNPNGKRVGFIDGRTITVEKVDAKKANLFAVSMSDVDITGIIAREMPLLAAAYVITGDRSYLDRVAAQLREVTQWIPLQRPGWELYTPTHSLPPDGDDGVWLATGQGLTAVWQTLEILPKGALPADLQKAVLEQFRREAERITKDWRNEKGWFMKQKVVTTNQWIVPSAGLAVACATLGREANPEAYDLAVTNLTHSVEALGKDGSVSEGVAYGQHWTGPFLYMAAQALAGAGDQRLASQPFFQKFPLWLAMQYQPGQWVINDFDNFGGARGLLYAQAQDVARLSALSRNLPLTWVLRHVIKVLPYDVYSLLTLTIPEEELQAPPLWAVVDRGHCAIWRSGWEEQASGVWVRGGHQLDGHDHMDRGHVNFIVEGKAVLLESATPGYDHPLKRERYESVMGHNVLQVDEDLYPRKSPAPITVKRMDAKGGDVTVEAGAGYPTVARWQRQVVWTAKRMEITDVVTLKKPGKVLFRWHLGSELSLKIANPTATSLSAQLPAGRIVFPAPMIKASDGLTSKNSDWQPAAEDIMETPAVTLSVQADRAIVGAEEKNLDHAFRFRQPNHQHTTFVVRSAEAVESITLKTVVELTPAATAMLP